MVRYPEPTRGASLLLALKPDQRPILVVGSGTLAATRIFAALEADASVLIAARGSIRYACEEVQWRVYHGDADWLDATEAAADEPDTQYAAFGQLLDSYPNVQLVCVTDTMNGDYKGIPRRSAASAKAIARACRDRRVLVNVADMPGLCDFTFPATHRFALSCSSAASTDPNLRTVDVKGSALQLAVTANGHGCRLASRLKREVVARLPRNVGDAVANVGRLRLLARSEDEDPEALSSAIAMRDSGVDIRPTVDADEDDATPINRPVPQRVEDETPAERCARRMRWVAQLSEYTPLEQLAAMDESAMRDVLESRGLVKSGGKCGRGRSKSPSKEASTSGAPTTSGVPSHHHLALSPPSSPTTGRIILVGSGPGHPALLTRAAHHALTQLATLVLADKLVPAEIMAIIPKSVEVRVAKKYPGNAEHAQDELIKLAIEGARAGKCVVRLKQGDPYLYGRGGEEILAFNSASPPLPHPTIVIPGISSALAAPLLAGIPVTQRNVADTLVVCTAVGKGGKGGVVLGYERGRSVSVLMGVARLSELVRCLVTGTSEGVEKKEEKRVVSGSGLSSTKPVATGAPAPTNPILNISISTGPPSTAYNTAAPNTPTTPSKASASTPIPAAIPSIITSAAQPSTTSKSPVSPDPNAPPTPITSPLTLSGAVYPPTTPIAIIERAAMPDQRLIASTLSGIERALEREGGGRPPGMVLVGWAVVALTKGDVLDIRGEGVGALDESRDRARVEKWLGGREYVVREGMEDGWEVFAGLGAA